MKIREIMTADAEAVEPEAALDETAYLMRSLGTACLPVLEGERLVGVITARDIVERAIAEGLNPAETTVRDVMTGEVISCAGDVEAEDAEKLMRRHGVRRLFIVDDSGDLCGFFVMDGEDAWGAA